MTFSKSVAAVVAAILATSAIFVIWPQIDLAVTGLFYDGKGFPWETVAPVSQLIRTILWDVSILMPVLALGLLVASLLRRKPVLLPAQVWAFVLALFVVGPGLIVNGIFKSYWGRARPFMVTEFGGEARFTPPWQITDQCARNCSFVSGEGAGSMAMAISVLLILFLLRQRLSTLVYRAGQGVTLAMLAFAGFQRVAAGRHFLSDVLLSWLFVGVIALVLARFLLARQPTGPRP
jgi:lipid A 4'-phosphatase